jgi:two-component system nitrogen regulation sensor histidine kinase NtrY
MRIRLSYWVWLILSVTFWSVGILYYRAHREEVLPAQMARIVNEDLASRERAFNRFMQNTGLVTRIFSDSISTQELKNISEQPFYLYAYDGDSLIFWSDNTFVAQNRDSLQADLTLRKNQKGIFLRRYLKQTALPGNKKLIVLYPILIRYPLENDYLHAHFAASPLIPVSTRIGASPTRGPDEYPILLPGNTTPVAYIAFNKEEIQKWIPDSFFVSILFVAILCTVALLQLVIAGITRNNKLLPLGIILAICISIRLLLFEWGVPFNLDTLTLFSPTLYASNRFLSSLGDLFISMLLVLWVLVFIIRNTRYAHFCDKIKSWYGRIGVSVLLLAFIAAYIPFFIKIIRSLILDSRISFDVTHFYSVSIYTGFGLLAIVSIMGLSCTILYLANIQLRHLIPNKWVKYPVIAAAIYLSMAILGHYTDLFYLLLLAGTIIFFILLDVPQLSLTSKLFEPRMIVWALILCTFSTLIVHYYTEEKEKAIRLAFVEQRLSPHHDDQLELSFDKTARLIEKDKTIKSFFYKPSVATRKTLNMYLDSVYLSGLAKYQTNIYLFDDEFKPLFNKDTTSYETLMNEKTEAVITNSAYLFYRESILNKHYYISYLSIYNDTVNNFIGYIFIGLDQKKAVTETVYPELLQPTASHSSPGDFEYSYAMYIGGKLVTQTNDYSFPIRLKYDTLKDQQYVFDSEGEYSTLYDKIADKRTVVVVHHHGEWIETIILFSFLFGIQVLIAVIIVTYQGYLYIASGKLTSLRLSRISLRRRVHLSMLIILMLSFVIIGIVTRQYFTEEYRKSNDNKLQAALEVAKQSVQDYLSRERAYNTGYTFDTVSRSQAFHAFITGLANNQKIDINIFDANGGLLTTSQDEIYDKGLMSRRMKPDAFHQMDDEGVSLVIQREQVAGLSYISAYETLRNEKGITLGYINVPFFTSEKDLNFQISNIIVTLINLYAFLFLLSGILTVFVTRWITKSFDIIIGQFSKLNLERNERIEWQYDDEIGMLVKEYNKMVRKVEENAARLAQSERESAWREMARQVAHEIKNPLTPMKLNIQYLQSAMRNDNPNIKQLTERVSASIIEQIDNLSYIASEFSNFAKLPEARPEELQPAAMIAKAVELYTKDEVVTVTLEQPQEELVVMCDHSQLLRVFTNLLENAKQAIPEGREGKIHVSVKKDGDDILISVADNGTGIDEETSRRIFQPYFTTKSSGTGLGLAMTKKIIEFWKGAIWFDTKEGEGTTFFIRLPLVEILNQ